DADLLEPDRTTGRQGDRPAQVDDAARLQRDEAPSIERRCRPDQPACDGKGAAIASGGDHEFDLSSVVDLQDRCQSLVEGHEKGGNLLRLTDVLLSSALFADDLKS